MAAVPLLLALTGPRPAAAQTAGGIPDGWALGGSVGRLWVDDTPNTTLTLVALRFSTLRRYRLGFDLEAALASGGHLDGVDLTAGTVYHLPLAGLGLLLGAGGTLVFAGGGEDAGGAAGLQLAGGALVPVSRRGGFRLEAAYRRYLTGGDGFNAVLLGVGFTSLPH